MSAPCKKLFLPLLLAIFSSIPCLHAAALRWVHLGTIEAGLVNMAIDGKIAYRNMPPGKSTSWGNVPAGLRRFQIGSEKNPGASFELEVTKDQKVVIVSVSDKNGDIQSRTVVLDAPEGEGFVLNALHNSMMGLPETENKVIFGKGFRIPIGKVKTTVEFSDGEGLKGALDFIRMGDPPKSPYLAILSSDDEGKTQLSVLRGHDSLFEIGDELIEIPNELVASVRIISERTVLGGGAFDHSLINWEQVESQIFWLNLMIGRDPCRLEIGGFPAMRRMPSGRGSGFVKWPTGGWETTVVVEATNEKLDTSNFTLSLKSSIGLISSGGGKYPARLMALEGRTRNKNPETAKPQIRFVNALPVGVMRCVIPHDPEKLILTIKPGEITEAVALEKGGFPGASLDLSLDKLKNQKFSNLPPMPSIPSGDWVVIIHLDQESFTAPVLTWVEMDKGSITTPGAKGGEE